LLQVVGLVVEVVVVEVVAGVCYLLHLGLLRVPLIVLLLVRVVLLHSLMTLKEILDQIVFLAL
jgi:hypothetical protein